MKSSTSKLSNQTGGRAMTDTNQASEEAKLLREAAADIIDEAIDLHTESPLCGERSSYAGNEPYDQADKILSLIRTEELKLLDKFENDCKYNYTTFGNSEKMLQVSGLLKRIEAERNKLEAEL